MTNETTSKSQPNPSEATPPWERVWNDLASGAGKLKDMMVEEVTKPFTPPPKAPPWERKWNDDKPPEPRKVAPTQFDKVFNRLIGAESNGVHAKDGKLTTSPVGAKGITQVMPASGKDPGYGVKPIANKSEGEYIRFGKDYLKAMLIEFGDDYEKALAAYNAGPGNVKAAIEKGGKRWKEHLPKPTETLPYIEKILKGK